VLFGFLASVIQGRATIRLTSDHYHAFEFELTAGFCLEKLPQEENVYGANHYIPYMASTIR